MMGYDLVLQHGIPRVHSYIVHFFVSVLRSLDYELVLSLYLASSQGLVFLLMKNGYVLNHSVLESFCSIRRRKGVESEARRLQWLKPNFSSRALRMSSTASILLHAQFCFTFCRTTLLTSQSITQRMSWSKSISVPT